MSVAALPPPIQLHGSLLSPSKRQLNMPRSAASTSNIASKPLAQVKARPSQPTPTLSRRPSSTASSTPRSTPALLPPTTASSSTSTPSGNKDTSSSSGKVFAKPSKEWVLPERAKPGRKVSVEEPDNKRQSQNRLSQRAHRARRTDYITTLEERLRQYEADEIHSNVRLQEVARALKADNERLKKEVISLRMDVNDLQSQRDTWEAERANYEEAIGRFNTQLNDLRGGVSSPPHFTRPTYTQRSVPALPTIVPNPDRRATLDCPICPDPDPDCPCQQRDQLSVLPPIQPTAPLAALHLAVKAMAEQHPDPTPGGDTSCGVCQNHDECLCRVINDMNDDEDIKPIIPPSPSPEISLGVSMDDGCGLCTSASFCACKATASSHGSSQSPMITSTTLSTTSISTAAVPLRLGRSRGKAAPIWALDPPSALTPKRNDDAVCSGDPSNCEACRDDRFGQEFCSNLFETSETSINEIPSNASSTHYQPTPLSTVTMNPTSHETMTADKAWKALKAHPNSKFASLSLLADVVSGRTMSTSAIRGEPSPAPSPLLAPVGREGAGLGNKKRSMAVETSAVRDALRLLDSTSAPSSPAISASGGAGDMGHASERELKKRKMIQEDES